MITGCGIDIVDTERFVPWMQQERFIRRFFHADEAAYIFSLPPRQGAESSAARFAAKEAFGKALGTGLAGFNLSDVCVCKDEAGKPFLRLYGSAEQLLKKNGAQCVHLSLAHEKRYAVAQVILEGGTVEARG